MAYRRPGFGDRTRVSSERLEATIVCVEPILSQAPPPGHPIVVVDHNEELRSQLPVRPPTDVELFANRGERDLCSARNTAVELSRGDVIVFIGDDAAARFGLFDPRNRPAPEPSARL